MTPEKEEKLTEYIDAIAALLYEETEPRQVESLAKIEETVRKQTLKYITPQLGIFLFQKRQELHQGESEN